MRLILTQYLDADPAAVTNELERAVGHGLAAAAMRIDATRFDMVTEPLSDGIRLARGLDILDGSELRITGEPRLTTLEIIVPWATPDRGGTKLLAANTFAHTVATEVNAAA